VTDDTNLRTRLLRAAEAQLAASADGDIATRAVCEAVGVTQPVLYRLFGDKQGLLDALVDDGFHRYVERKRALRETSDPVADLRAGWTDHMDFALASPALYRLMFAPRQGGVSTARRQIFDLLLATLTRCAAAGALTTSAESAAQTILSANVGVALNMMTQPDLYGDPTLPDRMREAVFAALLTEHESSDAPETVAATARQLKAQISLTPPDQLITEEQELLKIWLNRLTANPPKPPNNGPSHIVV
jgi:AcrR family transcriptional regulator